MSMIDSIDIFKRMIIEKPFEAELVDSRNMRLFCFIDGLLKDYVKIFYSKGEFKLSFINENIERIIICKDIRDFFTENIIGEITKSKRKRVLINEFLEQGV